MKTSVTIELSKLPRDKITERSYTDRNGNQHTVKEIRLDFVELKTPKAIKDFGDSVMTKTHFVAISQSKEEREAGAEAIYCGEGVQFIKPGAQPAQQSTQQNNDGFDDPLPF